MRFIARPREVAERPAVFLSPQVPGWTAMLKDFAEQEPRRIDYLSAFSVEVPDARLDAWRASVELRRTFDIRPARELRPIPAVDPGPGIPNSLRQIALDQLWNAGVTGNGVSVGIIDLGFGTHPCLAKAIASRSYYDSAKKQIVSGTAPGARNEYHGTFAAALIAGSDIDHVAIAAAPGAILHCVELPGVKFDDDLAIALQFLAETKRCRVISISLATWEPLPDMDIALGKARAANALTVAAIGNSGMGVAMWPAACELALSVGYCDEKGVLLPQSGSTHLERTRHAVVPKVVAPGVMLTSADVFTGGSTQDNGTSFAAPLVAGLAALLASACPHATPDQIEAAITATSRSSKAYAERCEFGLPSATAALARLHTITMC